MSSINRAIMKIINSLGYSVTKLPNVILDPLPDVANHSVANHSDVVSDQVLLSPVDRFLRTSYETFSIGHFDRHYIEWRMRRIRKCLQIEDLNFQGKKILELGGGHGDIGAFFAELGANVLSVDARLENCNFANLKHRKIPSFRSIQRNVDEDFTDLGRFDVVVSFGHIEVLDNIEKYIKRCCKITDKILCETIVMMSENPFGELRDVVPKQDMTDDHSYSGRVNPVSGPYIERVFQDAGFRVERFFHRDLNCGSHVYDWNIGDSAEDITPANFGLSPRRFWRFTKD